MAKTALGMVGEAEAVVPGLTPDELRQRVKHNPKTVLVDVRDTAEIAATGVIPGSTIISAGMLPFKADREVPEEIRDPRLQDRSQPVITICRIGWRAAIAAMLLHEMGFATVAYLRGGIEGWIAVDLPVEPATADQPTAASAV